MITIEGEKVSATSPEGQKATMSLATFLERARPRLISTGEDILPDGVKAIRTIGQHTVVVHQSPPQVYNLKWIDKDSESDYGSGTTYRDVRVALPYMLILATFVRDKAGRRLLTANNECFFRTESLTSMDNKLLFPGLLNCSKFANSEGRHLAWICTQHLAFPPIHQSKTPIRAGIKGLMQCLIGTGFNRSSEAHEGSSWYQESRSVDKRIATIEKWEEATEKDSLFALDVPWLDTGLTLDEMITRIVHVASGGASAKEDKVTAETLARHVFNK